jgi:hypothetical protein
MKYEYIDKITRDFPTLGLRNVKQGDTFISDIEINSNYVRKVLNTPVSPGNFKTPETPITPAVPVQNKIVTPEKEVPPVENKIEDEIKTEEDKIAELKSEENKGVV